MMLIDVVTAVPTSATAAAATTGVEGGVRAAVLQQSAIEGLVLFSSPPQQQRTTGSFAGSASDAATAAVGGVSAIAIAHAAASSLPSAKKQHNTVSAAAAGASVSSFSSTAMTYATMSAASSAATAAVAAGSASSPAAAAAAATATSKSVRDPHSLVGRLSALRRGTRGDQSRMAHFNSAAARQVEVERQQTVATAAVGGSTLGSALKPSRVVLPPSHALGHGAAIAAVSGTAASGATHSSSTSSSVLMASADPKRRGFIDVTLCGPLERVDGADGLLVARARVDAIVGAATSAAAALLIVGGATAADSSSNASSVRALGQPQPQLPYAVMTLPSPPGVISTPSSVSSTDAFARGSPPPLEVGDTVDAFFTRAICEEAGPHRRSAAHCHSSSVGTNDHTTTPSSRSIGGGGAQLELQFQQARVFAPCVLLCIGGRDVIAAPVRGTERSDDGTGGGTRNVAPSAVAASEGGVKSTSLKGRLPPHDMETDDTMQGSSDALPRHVAASAAHYRLMCTHLVEWR